MPDIFLDDSTFQRLQRHAVPFVDTPEAVVNRALDALEGGEPSPASEDERPVNKRGINPLNLPNMTHTKVLNASLGKERVARPNWNLLIERMLVHAMGRFQDIDELRRACPVNLVSGRKGDEGYRHVAEIDLSFQGLAANDACRALVAAARNLGVECTVTFEWRNKEGAAHPGETGQLFVAGALSA